MSTIPKYKQDALDALELVRKAGLDKVSVVGDWIQFDGSCGDLILELAKRRLGKQTTQELARLITEAKGAA